MVNARFVQCYEVQLASCQLGIDEGIARGIEGCTPLEWSEVPDGVKSSDLAEVVPCLRRLKAEQDALQVCISKTTPRRDASDELRCHPSADQESCGRSRGAFMKERATCMKGAASSLHLCPLVTVAAGMAAFRTAIKFDDVYEDARSSACNEDLVRAAEAVRDQAPRFAEQALVDAADFCVTDSERAQVAKVRDHIAPLQATAKAAEAKRELAAKAADRCGGATTSAFVLNATVLRRSPPTSTRGCRYRITAKVDSSNQTYVQVSNFPQDLHLLRTRETFATGTWFNGSRYATYEGMRHVSLANNTSHAFHVFKLLP